MIDDMTMRKLAPGTQRGYLRAVERFVQYFRRSPDLADAEDLREFQLYLATEGVSSTNINQILTGLRFFYTVTLSRPEVLAKVSHVPEAEKLPVILSPEEVTRLLAAAANLKHKAALAVAYGAGLRASEVVNLTSTDIDSERMLIRVEQGKGSKDRHAMLSQNLLELLRAWWREGRAKQQLLPRGWLFPGRNPVNQMSTRQLNRAFHLALNAAEIDKRVSLHSLRNAYT
jgi:site-specific recombinase XerD